MKLLTVVIPVYNEEKRLTKTFAALKALTLPIGLKLDEVIFVNDGSTDNTLILLKTFSRKSKNLPISIISYSENRGKGFAVKKGMLASKASYTLLCDADMSTPFSELAKFVKYAEQEIDIVIGTRKNGKSTVVIHQPKIRELLGKGFTYFTQTTLRLPITDFTCGFKLFSRNAVQVIFPKAVINRWGYDAEILFIGKKNALSMVECPVIWLDTKGSHVRIATDIPKTVIEIGRIILTHSLVPRYSTFSSLTHKRLLRILAVSH